MRSAFSITIRLALGTSTPTSITVVATSRSSLPCLNEVMTASFCLPAIRPWIRPMRTPGSASASCAAVFSAAS